MVTSTVVSVDFRTAQVVSDLRCVARQGDLATLAGISAGVPNADAGDDLVRLIHAEGCRIATDGTARLHAALVLAATLPNDDFSAFVVATATLLADRLQDGGGSDDLFWHWDAFREHYAIAPPPVRAAIMQGYAAQNALGLVALLDPPSVDDLTTEPGTDILEALRPLTRTTNRTLQGIARKLIDETLSNTGADFSQRLWSDRRDEIFDFPEPQQRVLLRAVRFLCQRCPKWAPFRGQTFNVFDPDLPVLPFDG